jgi:hypothetical protein
MVLHIVDGSRTAVGAIRPLSDEHWQASNPEGWSTANRYLPHLSVSQALANDTAMRIRHGTGWEDKGHGPKLWLK